MAQKPIAAIDKDSTFTDSRDGKIYRTVRIGSLVWMAENLNHNAGANWCYDNDDLNCKKFGRLYDRGTAMNICPQGWRLPSRSEWNYLVQNAGGDLAGTKLKARSPFWNGTDDFEFSALPGGYRNTLGSFYYVGSDAYWWSVSDKGSYAYRWRIGSSGEGIYESYDIKSSGFSVRCVQG